jgi:hypothetical protein
MPPTTFENPRNMLRSFKGSPISIIFALLIVKRPMSGIELQDWTGYADENITKGLRVLVDDGWIVAIGTRGPWALTDRARQLPLMPSFLDPGESDLIGDGLLFTTDGGKDRSILNDGSRSNSLTRSSPIKSESAHLNPNFEANLQACRKFGIGEPKASEIADLIDDMGQAVTPDFILDHCASLIDGETIGLAIIRIIGGEYPRCWFNDIPSRRDGS